MHVVVMVNCPPYIVLSHSFILDILVDMRIKDNILLYSISFISLHLLIDVLCTQYIILLYYIH
jgi:hypothetical protein